MMQVYIEYVILENFFIDGALLYLALSILKRKISCVRIMIAAAVGAAFAALYPLLRLPDFLSYLLKFSVGGLLVFIASKREKGVGRYALNALSFFAVSFLFAGMLIAAYDLIEFENGYLLQELPVGALLVGVAALSVGVSKGVKAFYRRRKQARFLYGCEFVSGETTLKTTGYLDSGNLASFQGVPVCFLTPECFLKLIRAGQGCDEMEIMTVSGVKKIKIFKLDELRIYLEDGANIIKSVYVSPSKHLKGREYDALLNGLLLE